MGSVRVLPVTYISTMRDEALVKMWQIGMIGIFRARRWCMILHVVRFLRLKGMARVGAEVASDGRNLE